LTRQVKDLRSTCATQLIAEATPTLAVRDLLGHSTVATTERYYASAATALRDAIARRNVV
jgi:integrase